MNQKQLTPDDLIQELPEAVLPEQPIKRRLTQLETFQMRSYFKEYAFFDCVDDFNRIIMGGGDFDKGKLYIEPEDLLKLK